MIDEQKGEEMGQVIQIDEARIKDHLGEMVRGTVAEVTCPLKPDPGAELENSASGSFREGAYRMSRKRISVEQIINHLREAEELLQSDAFRHP
jgi:hypothetical protein